jgi:integrase
MILLFSGSSRRSLCDRTVGAAIRTADGKAAREERSRAVQKLENIVMTDLPRAVVLAKLEELDRERAELLRLLEPEPAPEKPAPHRRRLTKSVVAALPIPSDKYKIYWDRDLPGFGLRISAFGTRTYFLQVRTKTGRGIKVTLGRASRITAEQARDAARKHLAAVDLGRDPAAEIKAGRRAEKERRTAPDLATLWEAYTKSPAFLQLRPKSRAGYSSWWQRHVGPAVGGSKVAELSARDAARLHERLSAGTGRSTGNRCHAVLSAVMAHGVRLGLIGVNPCRGAVRVNPEPGRERLLDDVELGRLLSHLAGCADLEARVVEFLLSSAGRVGETLAMRWRDLTADGRWWIVPAEVSKSGKIVRRPLNQAARDILGRVERGHADDPVFGVAASRLGKWWQKARAQLRLDDVRLHDLRHAAASLALNSGVPLSAISGLLGHGPHSASMSARYSHLADEQLTRAARELGDRLEALRTMPPAGRA